MNVGFPTGPASNKPVNAFESVQQALIEARDLTIRVENVVERLLGAAPQQGESAEVVPTPDGMLANMQDDAERTRRFVRAAGVALDRLQKSLS